MTESSLQGEYNNDFESDKETLSDYSTMLLAGVVDNLADTAINSVIDEGVGISKSFLERYFPTVELGGLSMGGEKPQWNVLVVAPLSDESDIHNTIFTQVSANHKDDRTTLNLGLGYRSLSQDKTTLLGMRLSCHPTTSRSSILTITSPTLISADAAGELGSIRCTENRSLRKPTCMPTPANAPRALALSWA